MKSHSCCGTIFVTRVQIVDANLVIYYSIYLPASIGCQCGWVPTPQVENDESMKSSSKLDIPLHRMEAPTPQGREKWFYTLENATRNGHVTQSSANSSSCSRNGYIYIFIFPTYWFEWLYLTKRTRRCVAYGSDCKCKSRWSVRLP